MIVLSLPYPLSANAYWRPVNMGKHITIVPTKEAKAYKRTVATYAMMAGITRPIPGRVAVHIDLYPQRPQDWQARMRKLGSEWDTSVRCIDIDNARKVLYDALKGIAFEDDAMVWRDSARRMAPDERGARVIVRIEPVIVEQPQPALIYTEAHDDSKLLRVEMEDFRPCAS